MTNASVPKTDRLTEAEAAPRRRQQLQDRAAAAYLGLAIGDALGATVEFMTPVEIRCEHGVHDRVIGGGWLRLRPGQVTDDTTMALALGESILRSGGVVQAQAAAEAFSEWMAGKPVDIGNTVRRGIVAFRRHGTVAVEENEFDAGNGACMRVLPVAFATFGLSAREIREAVLAQAHVTHNNALSDAACETVVVMVQMAMAGADKRALLQGPVNDLIHRHPEFAFRCRRIENPSGYVVHTLQAVFQAFFDTDDFKDCLVDVVNRGGDADTTGAIAGMLAGAIYGLAGVPRQWRSKLDKATAKACLAQAASLMAC